MSVPILLPAFSVGEVAPSIFGRFDTARMHVAAATMRNMFVSFRGGAYSRAGTAFVGFSKQTGRLFPPRLMTFQFNINQGLALEFGNQYMRVIQNGGFVLEAPIKITGITQANPAVVSIANFSAASATANDSAVSSSYAAGDTITIAGGTGATPTQLGVVNSTLLSLNLIAPGNPTRTGYVPGQVIALSGGAQTVVPTITVLTTQVTSASIAGVGVGGTPGPATLTGTSGAGAKYQLSVTINAFGQLQSINAITSAGSYGINPAYSPGNAGYIDPANGGGFSTLPLISLQMGLQTFQLSNGGAFTTNSFTLTAVPNGDSYGAVFNTAVYGPHDLSVINPGVYTVPPANPASQASTSGTGSGAVFNLIYSSGLGFNTGDWIYVSGVNGMTQVNNRTFVVTSLTSTTFALHDVYGNNINSTGYGAWTSGGTAARVYTLVTPYLEQDLPWLKITESADVMTVCCVNQTTQVEYAPQDLSRITNTDWTFTPVVPNETVSPPTGIVINASTSGSVDYAYVVTSISPVDGTESIASAIGTGTSFVNVATTAGTITITWTPAANVTTYYVYKALPGYTVPVPPGALYGFAGQAFGAQFIDTNITADFQQTPPTHQNPFAPGQILAVNVTTAGGGYTTAVGTINTTTGSGAVLTGIIQNGGIVAWIVANGGGYYSATDTITITGSGGSGATATLSIGPQTGTYPSTPSYFQERRILANSLNNPDTYWMSQPGSFTNYDFRVPTLSSDAITGSPWAVEVNGIQFMVSMPGGLVVLTGLSAWQLTGAGGSSLNPQPLSPSTQQAQPQAYNGCSATVPPIRIDYDIIYVQAKGSIYRDLAYQFYTNIYTGTDLTLNSSHLFTGYTIREHAWCEEPYKILWAARNDGILLSLTYLKPEQIQGWARHDTNGLFQSVCSVTEPPVDALYMAVQRPLAGAPANTNVYTIERMDDRIWAQAEDSWCVDAGLGLGMPIPNAILTASSATGLGALTGVTGLVGGSNYSGATTAVVVDYNGQGPGTGAVVVLTIALGVITGVTFSSQGTGYVQPALVITDPSGLGSGASAVIVLSNAMTFTASTAVFSVGNVGNVIRMGNGKAVITAYGSSTAVTGNIMVPITVLDPVSGVPAVAASGDWTMSTPVTSVGGLYHLAGMTVTGLADGNVIAPQTVSATGGITLSTPATAVTVGLGYPAQLQTVYLDGGQPTIQGQRKKVAAVTVRMEASRQLVAGANQTDGSTLSPAQIAPSWPAQNFTVVQDKGVMPYNDVTQPLFTGDSRVILSGGFQTPGQVAVMQTNPLPMQILSLEVEGWEGDQPETNVKPAERKGR